MLLFSGPFYFYYYSREVYAKPLHRVTACCEGEVDLCRHVSPSQLHSSVGRDTQSVPDYLASDLQRVSDLGARRRLRSSTTSALVGDFVRRLRQRSSLHAPFVQPSATEPSRRLLHLSGTVCRRQYVRRRHCQFSAVD